MAVTNTSHPAWFSRHSCQELSHVAQRATSGASSETNFARSAVTSAVLLVSLMSFRRCFEEVSVGFEHRHQARTLRREGILVTTRKIQQDVVELHAEATHRVLPCAFLFLRLRLALRECLGLGGIRRGCRVVLG